MGDQAMATLDDADWSEESHMDECDPGAGCPVGHGGWGERSSIWWFYSLGVCPLKLHLQILPNDREHREGFDAPITFRLGDPNVHFHAAAAKPYETSGATGKPEWASLFGFILARMSHLRFLSTVYVLVDNRDLTNLDNPEPSLQHWPAVAAWWSSRACMQGPAQERCDVVFFPISQASGLHLVHPTWAGTFVLAALCLVFPGLHIVLLDSDCVPVTLFEVEDLWQEAHRLQPSGFPGSATTSSCAGGLNLDGLRTDGFMLGSWSDRPRIGNDVSSVFKDFKKFANGILCGRRNICWCWRTMPLVPLIVNEVSCMMMTKHVSLCAWQA